MAKKILSASERRMAAILKEAGGVLKGVTRKNKKKKTKVKSKATFE